MSETLYIIDSHSHLYASYFAIPNLTAPDGEPTGALYGFTNAVLKILRDKRPHYMVAVYDGPEETFRKKAYADYKVTRKPMPDDLAPQIERSKEVVALLGVRAVDAPGYEADDLVALFTERARRGGCQVVIVSRDKDLMQLLGPGVVMYDTRKDLVMDAAWLEAEKGLRPEQIVDWLGLMGDASDNIPGVPGIGQKRAVALLQQWGSMDEILAHADQVKGKMGQSLRENAELARLSRGLATLTTDIPVDLTYQDLAVAEPDREKVAALFKQLAFKKLAEQFALPTAPLAQSAAAAEKKQFECVTTKAALKKLAAKLNRAKVLAFDTELTGLDPLRDRLVGLSFSTAAGQGTYVPVLAPEGQEHLSLATVTEAIGPVMANARSLKVAHNAKFDLAVLATAGITVRGPLFDTMIASYLLDPGSRRHGLDPLAEEHLAYLTVPISELIGEKKRGAEQKTMDQVPLEQITNYAAEDAEVTLGLYEVFAARLNDQGRGQGNLSKLFWDVEMPLVRVLEKMERQGVALDLDLLADLSRKFGRRMDKLRQEIHREAGREFNVDSPKQLAEVLFDEIGLKPV
ncbi:MAG: DNA polymerase I, partial [Anaerolineaceae bacterium]|nr:DNA polymerase I [Anaerolineaceae bacterium]